MEAECENNNTNLWTELAGQMCIFQSEAMQKLEFSEFSGMAWVTTKSLAPNIVKLIHRFNKVAWTDVIIMTLFSSPPG
jgi:hypothetical protein